MKKVLALIFAMMMMLTACSNNTGGKQEENVRDSQKGEEVNEAESVTETKELDKMLDLARFYAQKTRKKVDMLTDGDWSYYVYTSIDDPEFGYSAIYQYNGTSEDVIVPDALGGFPVIDIVSFSTVKELENDIVSIKFPNTLMYFANPDLDNTTWYSNQPDGPVYTGTVLYKYKGTAAPGTELIIDEGTMGIACEAVDDDNITSIIMPNSLYFIANRGIHGCKSLNNIKISANLLGLNNNSLNIQSESLTDIFIPDTLIYVNSGNTFGKGLTIHYAGTEEEFKKVRDYDAVSNTVIYESTE